MDARHRLLVLVASVVVLASCGDMPQRTGAPSVSSGSGEPSLVASQPPEARAAGWRADLEALVPGMARLHTDLDHGTPASQLSAAVTDLEGRIERSTDDELLVGVMRIVAMVSAHGCDAHTGIYVWGEGTYPVDSLPLRLWWFADGIRVVDTLDPYRALIGRRIESVGGHPIDEVLAAIQPLIPRDNDQTLRLLMPRFLLMPQVLRGLGLAGAGSIRLRVGDGSGPGQDVDVAPIPMADYNAWAGPYGLHLPADRAVPYLSRIGDALWWQLMDDGTLFVQENRVERLGTSQLDAIRAAIHGPGVQRVVVDLRHNYGGEVGGVDPFVALFTDPAIDRPGRLFVVTGRNTFSAASLIVARLVASSGARIVGESMGGCPTAYGNARPLTLSYSGLVVDVATQLETGIAADDGRPTIEPHIAAPLTFDAWRQGVDPALAALHLTGG